MANLVFLFSYFSNTIPLTILISTLMFLVGLYVLARKNVERPGIRYVVLLLMLGIYVFAWVFLTSSIAICFSISDYYLYHPEFAIKSVVSSAISIAILAALPSSLIINRLASRSITKSIPGTLQIDKTAEDNLLRLADTMSISNTHLREFPTGAPISFAVSGRNNLVVVSAGLRKLLDRDELEAVLGHELSHIRHRDSTIKTVTSLLRGVIFFDPLLRLVDSAISREMEFRADEEAAYITGKPRSLASALIKIHRDNGSNFSEVFLGLCLTGTKRSPFSRHPSLVDRVERLLRLAGMFETVHT